VQFCKGVLKIEAVNSFKTLVPIYQTTHLTYQKTVLFSHHHENLELTHNDSTEFFSSIQQKPMARTANEVKKKKKEKNPSYLQ
jgi:hypothetical protein